MSTTGSGNETTPVNGSSWPDVDSLWPDQTPFDEVWYGVLLIVLYSVVFTACLVGLSTVSSLSSFFFVSLCASLFVRRSLLFRMFEPRMNWAYVKMCAFLSTRMKIKERVFKDAKNRRSENRTVLFSKIRQVLGYMFRTATLSISLSN